jgi:snRNA-activating protein complex subunit 3
VAIRIYRPIKASIRNQAAATTNANRYIQEIHMLGSNKLSDLRDVIKCPADYIVPGEVSTTPNWVAKQQNCNQTMTTASNKTVSVKREVPKKMAKDLYKSGFFFIEDTFYNDMRWPDCHDSSEVIRTWASDSRRKIGPFSKAKMEETMISDMAIRLGYPYVYVHQVVHIRISRS